jgi:hypothetical protein
MATAAAAYNNSKTENTHIGKHSFTWVCSQSHHPQHHHELGYQMISPHECNLHQIEKKVSKKHTD